MRWQKWDTVVAIPLSSTHGLRDTICPFGDAIHTAIVAEHVQFRRDATRWGTRDEVVWDWKTMGDGVVDGRFTSTEVMRYRRGWNCQCGVNKVERQQMERRLNSVL